MSILFRIAIGLTALGLAGVHFALPDVRFDTSFFILIGVALLAFFTRGIRIKGLDLMGIKVEFDTQEQRAAPVAAELENSVRAPQIPPGKRPPWMPEKTYSIKNIQFTPIEIIASYMTCWDMVG
jgi:hypothetical protein